MFIKRWKAGSQISPSLWHASTHDWPCSDVKSRSAVRGGHDGKELVLADQVSILEFGKGRKGPDSEAQDVFTGGNGISGEQKSCKGKDKKIK